MVKSKAWTYYTGLLFFLTSCYSFDKDVALKEFKELRPNCEIVEMFDYECDGTLGECWYVEFKYKKPGSEKIYEETFQYWNKDDKWITRKEKLTLDSLYRINQ